ncbi:hypothetical protein KKG24_00145 [Patescibacteria group bacterium]|nr:hypothetical protein [Patescibacteria group bacterium]
MKNSKENGFIQIIILLIISLFVMKFFGITISEVFNWFSSFFKSVLK